MWFLKREIGILELSVDRERMSYDNAQENKELWVLYREKMVVFNFFITFYLEYVRRRDIQP